MSQFCKNCGKPIVVMIQKNSGFCTPRCEETFAERGVCAGDGEANCYCREDE